MFCKIFAILGAIPSPYTCLKGILNTRVRLIRVEVLLSGAHHCT